MTSRRTYLIYGLLLFLGLVVFAWLHNYLTRGTLEVTNKDGSISINRPTVNGITGTQVAQGSSKIKLKLKTGSYIISTAGSTVSVSQTIKVKAHMLSKFDITPRSTASIEPVLSEDSQNIAAGNRIVYLNPTDSKLYKLDSSNNLSQIAPSLSFRNIQWSDSSYGVAQDNSGNLFVIDGETVRPLALQPDIKQPQYTKYTVTRSRDIYLAYLGNLYLGSERQVFKKIQSNLDPASLLVAGNHILAWIDDGDANNKGETAPSILVINNGKKIKKDKVGSFVGAWSPDDARLAISSQDGGEILDPHLKVVASIPQSSFKEPVWLSNSKLAYSTSGQVWVYDIDSQRSDEIAQANAGETISQIAPSQDGSYLYLGITSVSGVQSIRRVSLTGSQISPDLLKLTIFLPFNLSECSVGYINFTQLAILLRPYGAYPPNQCLQDAKNNLAEDQLGVGSLDFKLGPVLP